MYKRIIALVVALMTVFLISCSSVDRNKNPNLESNGPISVIEPISSVTEPILKKPEDYFPGGASGKLIVNGTEIIDAPVVMLSDEHRAIIPLQKLMKCLGATIETESDGCVAIFYDNSVFLLDINNCLLTSNNMVKNIIMPPAGSTNGVFWKTIDGELFVDTSSLTVFFVSIDVQVFVDWTNNQVQVTKTD